MASSITWIDHDPHERERMTRILALFSERESRDELGLGSIRDSLGDILFPGTSTIQTRLRYMLFIPWIYQKLERSGVAASEVARRARKDETALIVPLLTKEEEGVLGRLAKGELKRLPSSVYWAGLGAWGIRCYQGHQDQYHRAFDRIQSCRAASRRRDDMDVEGAPILTWHPKLPAPPPEFPNGVTFDLQRVEAEFLRDRILECHSESLLAWLVRDSGDVPDVEQLWEHPARGRFTPIHEELVQYASLFSELTFGAALLYNLQLAERRNDDELVSEYVTDTETWVDGLQKDGWHSKLHTWDIGRFWLLLHGGGHTITERARSFVETWLGYVRLGTLAAVTSKSARDLVREREQSLKRAQSRFQNRRALDQWSGRAGVFRANYRWRIASRLLLDLKTGLTAKGAE